MGETSQRKQEGQITIRPGSVLSGKLAVLSALRGTSQNALISGWIDEKLTEAAEQSSEVATLFEAFELARRVQLPDGQPS